MALPGFEKVDTVGLHARIRTQWSVCDWSTIARNVLGCATSIMPIVMRLDH